MYSSCLFCNADLGRNESVEVFPVIHPDGTRTTVLHAKARFADTLCSDPEASALAAEVGKAGRAWWPWSLGSLPRTGTANQWLTDAQFEGYVRLGRAVGARITEIDGPGPAFRAM